MVYCFVGSEAKSAGPGSGVLKSLIVGKMTSTQMGLESKTLKKLHSFLVTADAACSTGDLPVVTVEATLVAVTGLATAAVATVDPAALTAAPLELPIAAMGATQPCSGNRQSIPIRALQ